MKPYLENWQGIGPLPPEDAPGYRCENTCWELGERGKSQEVESYRESTEDRS